MLAIITAVLPFAIKLIEMFMEKAKADKEARELMVKLAKTLQALGVKGLKSRFEQEEDQKAAGDAEWGRIEAEEAATRQAEGK